MSDFERPSEDVLSAYLDGECTDDEQPLVESLLASDDEWRSAYDDVRSARDAVRALPVREAPQGFWERVVHDVELGVDVDAEFRARRPGARDSRSRFPRAVAFAAAAAAAAALLALALPSNPPDVAPELAELSDSHGTASSPGGDPVSELAPVAIPVDFGP